MATNDEFITSMTSIFTPFSNCQSYWTYEPQSYNSFTRGLIRQNINNDPKFISACFPPGMKSMGITLGSITQIFSPGACPEGYTIAQGPFPTLAASIAGCCPRDFYSYGFLGSSASNLVWTMGCISTWSSSSVFPARVGDNSYKMSSLSGTITQWAQMVTVQWQEKDLSLFTAGTLLGTPVSVSAESTDAILAVSTRISSNSVRKSASSSISSASSAISSSSFIPPTPTSVSNSNIPNNGAIIGGIIGGAFMMLLTGIVVITIRQFKNRKSNTEYLSRTIAEAVGASLQITQSDPGRLRHESTELPTSRHRQAQLHETVFEVP